MFRYKLKKLDTQEIKAQLQIEEDIENPWAEKFAKFDVFAGMYNSRDAILDENGVEIEPARVKNYEVIKEDISYEHELNLCIKNRKAEYPSIEEVLHALLDEGNLDSIQAKRALVKAKYPKPSEG